MSLFDRDSNKHVDSPGGAPRDPSAASSSNSDADDSAAVIANLVRRTSERHAGPGPSPAAHPDVTAPQPPMSDPPVAQPVTQRFAQPVTQQVAQPVTQQVAQQVTQQVAQPVQQPEPPRVGPPDTSPAHPSVRQPSRRALVAGGAIAAVLIVSGFALSHSGGSQARPTSPIASAAPAVYTVQVTDVITNCASHSHGRTRSSFKTENCVKATRSLATGQVSGRPTIFVVSRIQMASAEAAASVKEILDATGTGNLNDLLREGKTFPGAPGTMPDSGYASVQTGTDVVVAEAGFVKGPSASSNPALRAAAARVAALVTAGS
jgi:hypothetical protein